MDADTANRDATDEHSSGDDDDRPVGCACLENSAVGLERDAPSVAQTLR